MLDNTTPIPADLNSSFLSAWISPYVDIPSTQGDLTVPLPADRQGTGCCGFGPNPFYALGAWYTLGEVLMQAELTIDQPPPPPPPTNPVKIGKPRLQGNTVSLPVVCVLDATCRGVLQLLSQEKSRANARHSRSSTRKSEKPTVYGRARFSIPAHRKMRVKVTLGKAGKRLLKRSRRRGKPVRMVARAIVDSQVTTSTIELNLRRRRK